MFCDGKPCPNCRLSIHVPLRQEKVVKVANNSTALDAFSKIQTNAVSGLGVIDEAVWLFPIFVCMCVRGDQNV